MRSLILLYAVALNFCILVSAGRDFYKILGLSEFFFQFFCVKNSNSLILDFSNRFDNFLLQELRNLQQQMKLKKPIENLPKVIFENFACNFWV